jgi:hypothetical protein
VDDFEERHLLVGAGQVVGGEVLVGLGDGESGVVTDTGAARFLTPAEGGGLVARGFLASQLALGLGAQFGGLALPGALGLLAERRAVGLGGGAGGAADGGAADSLASGAVFHFAHLLGAADGADGLLAVNLALGAFGGLAVHLAFGTSAHGVALGGAHGVIAQPLALRVALGRGGHGHGNEKKSNDRLHGRR